MSQDEKLTYQSAGVLVYSFVLGAFSRHDGTLFAGSCALLFAWGIFYLTYAERLSLKPAFEWTSMFGLVLGACLAAAVGLARLDDYLAASFGIEGWHAAVWVSRAFEYVADFGYVYGAASTIIFGSIAFAQEHPNQLGQV
jgi:hypothetical protein